IMISDGMPNACSTKALEAIVKETQQLSNTRLAQIAVDDVIEQPFGDDNFILVKELEDKLLPLRISKLLLTLEG
ncbi:MAG: hypothetical protein HQK79_23275, partial [Desulfobacterales bacterium]|nr:hypothetical protein [Desulfobacterales bacterium]